MISSSEANDGAAIYVFGGMALVEGSQLLANIAQNNGAALLCDSNAAVSISQTTIAANLATSVGGSLSVQGGCELLVVDSIITNSTILRDGSPVSMGGAVSCVYASVSILQSQFSYNSANQGSDLYSFFCNVSMQYMAIHDASSDDGSIFSIGSRLVFKDSILHSSNGLSSAAGIYCSESVYCVIERSNFASNYASEGGVISVSFSSVNISDCSFIDNLSGSFAGAVYLFNSPFATISNCEFVRNRASTYGGAIAAEIGSNVILDHSVFRNNTAVAGGAIYLFHDTNLSATSTEFCNNQGDDMGGAICLGDHVSLQASDIVIQNSTSAFGGAIYATYMAILGISNLTATNNKAGYAGTVLVLYMLPHACPPCTL
jgi:predicted outer membrane repeat protein